MRGCCHVEQEGDSQIHMWLIVKQGWAQEMAYRKKLHGCEFEGKQGQTMTKMCPYDSK